MPAASAARALVRASPAQRIRRAARIGGAFEDAIDVAGRRAAARPPSFTRP